MTRVSAETYSGEVISIVMTGKYRADRAEAIHNSAFRACNCCRTKRGLDCRATSIAAGYEIRTVSVCTSNRADSIGRIMDDVVQSSLKKGESIGSI